VARIPPIQSIRVPSQSKVDQRAPPIVREA
jgi:hypothetical protein